MIGTNRKTRAAGVAIGSNTCLIVIKIVAGVATGSVGILSDAVHSLMDLIASLIAWVSVRKADEPADSLHRYGHEKFEDLAAGAQALLLLVGAAFVAFEAVRRLVDGGRINSVGIGIAVAGAAVIINFGVSTHLARTGRATGSAALNAGAADLRTDMLVSFAVLVALVLYKITGAAWIDPVAGLLVAIVITNTGVRILLAATRRLIDEALPADELAAVHEIIRSFIGEEVVGSHDVRARHVGSHHQVDLHLQFADGTSLHRAHELSHQLQDAVVERLPGTTLLVHLEPQDRVRPDRFDDSLTTTVSQPPPGESDRPSGAASSAP